MIGTRIGAFEIIAKIGEGGMGEVYRATDTKLKRQVAIKALPASVAGDAERLARFQREAEVLASLNHPNIAAIHGLEEADGVSALVMELVEGPTLADRIAQGAIPLDDALPIARQIAEALEAAHEHGIIHRDLKPANVKVRADGTVKVLDFGLAKAIEQGSGIRDQGSVSPTLTSPALVTGVGMLLGTAAYMAPEQARGKTVDKRADIWAFGVVVFEMLTGSRAFAGDDVSITLASVMMKEPEWSALPAQTPVGLRRLLTRCLKKDPKARMRDIGDARLQIEELLGGATEDPAPDVAMLPPAMPWRRIVAIAGAALVVAAAIAAFATWSLTGPALVKLQPMRFTLVPPAAQPRLIAVNRNIALSSDGTRLVYAGGVRPPVLMVRAIDQLDAVPLSGITDSRSPFISPDGRWIGFFSDVTNGELKKVSVTGGPPIPLARYQGQARGASWGPDDTIVFSTDDTSSGLLKRTRRRRRANGAHDTRLRAR